MRMLNLQEEADRLLKIFGDNMPALMDLMQAQFTVLHTRAQVLLGLSGVVVTTTGFSGRVIAGTNLLAQWLIIAGVSLSLGSALVVVTRVLQLSWLTQQSGDLIRPWLLQCLEYRDMKTRFYRLAILLLLAGLASYVAAIAIMLLHPRGL